MPCMKCSNGKWKYGERGRCQFDTLEACQAAAAAIHAQEKDLTTPQPGSEETTLDQIFKDQNSRSKF